MKKEKTRFHFVASAFVFVGALVLNVTPATAGFVTINPPGSTSRQAFGVSGNNVVGRYVDSNSVSHGFEYNGSTYTRIDPLGSIDTTASAVSANNIVGWYYDANGV